MGGSDASGGVDSGGGCAHDYDVGNGCDANALFQAEVGAIFAEGLLRGQCFSVVE
jgi:hypothetical protein